MPGRRAGKMSGGSAINGSTCGMNLENLMESGINVSLLIDKG